MTVMADKMEAIRPDYLLWIGLVIICFLLNLITTRKSISIGLLAALNGIWMALTAILVSLTFTCNPESVPLKIFICGILIIIEGHSIALALFPPKASTQLTFLDILAVVFTIFLAGCHLKGFQDVAGLQILGFISVGYTLVSLIILRTSEDSGPIVRGDSVSNRIKVFGLLAAIVAASCIACGALTVIAKNIGSSLIDILLIMFRGFKQALFTAGGFFKRLIALIPVSDSVPAAIGNYAGDPPAEETGAQAIMRLPEWVLPLAGILILVLISLFLLRLLYNFRREKVSFTAKTRQVTLASAENLPARSDGFFQRLFAGWKLRLLMFKQRKTPKGLAILIRKSGKSLGVTMEKADSWHSYVNRLMPYGDPAVLSELAAFMEQYFYGRQKPDLSRQQYQTFATVLKQLKKPE